VPHRRLIFPPAEWLRQIRPRRRLGQRTWSAAKLLAGGMRSGEPATSGGATGRQPGRSDSLHRSAFVERSRAEAQAGALERFGALLSAAERRLVRPGTQPGRAWTRRGDRPSYGRATGFETMVGWLFLRNPGRLAQLLDQLEQPARPLPRISHDPTYWRRGLGEVEDG